MKKKQGTSIDGKERVLFVSTYAKEFAYGDERIDNKGSFFTSLFIEGCDGGKHLAEMERGLVSVSSLADYIRRGMDNSTQRNRQHFREGILGNFYLRYNYGNDQSNHELNEDTRPIHSFILFPPKYCLNRVNQLSITNNDDVVSVHTSTEPFLFAVGYTNEGIKIFDPNRIEFPIELSSAKPASRGIQFSPDGMFITYISNDNRYVLHSLKYAQSTNKERYISLSPGQFTIADNDILIAANPTDYLLHFRYLSNLEDEDAGIGLDMQSRAVHIRTSVDEDHKFAVVGCVDGNLFLYDFSKINSRSRQIKLVPSVIVPAYESLAFAALRVAISKSGEYIASGFGNGRVILWQTGALDKELDVNIPQHQFLVTALEISSDNRWLASGGGEGIVHITDISQKDSTYTYIIERKQSIPDEISCLSFARKHGILGVGTREGKVLLLYPGNARKITTLLEDMYDNPVFRIAFFEEKARSLKLMVVRRQAITIHELLWEDQEFCQSKQPAN